MPGHKTRIPLLRRWRKTKLVFKTLLVLAMATLLVRFSILPAVWRVQANIRGGTLEFETVIEVVTNTFLEDPLPEDSASE